MCVAGFDTAAGLLVSLVVSWTLVAFGQADFDLLTLAAATYLIVIAPLLFRDEALPEHHLIGECIAVLGSALLLLPTLWLSFAESELNLVYTVVLLLKSWCCSCWASELACASLSFQVPA